MAGPEKLDFYLAVDEADSTPLGLALECALKGVKWHLKPIGSIFLAEHSSKLRLDFGTF